MYARTTTYALSLRLLLIILSLSFAGSPAMAQKKSQSSKKKSSAPAAKPAVPIEMWETFLENGLYGIRNKETKEEICPPFYKEIKIYFTNQIAEIRKAGDLIGTNYAIDKYGNSLFQEGLFLFNENPYDNMMVVSEESFKSFLADYSGKRLTPTYKNLEHLYDHVYFAGNDDETSLNDGAYLGPDGKPLNPFPISGKKNSGNYFFTVYPHEDKIDYIHPLLVYTINKDDGTSVKGVMNLDGKNIIEPKWKYIDDYDYNTYYDKVSKIVPNKFLMHKYKLFFCSNDPNKKTGSIYDITGKLIAVNQKNNYKIKKKIYLRNIKERSLDEKRLTEVVYEPYLRFLDRIEAFKATHPTEAVGSGPNLFAQAREERARQIAQAKKEQEERERQQQLALKQQQQARQQQKPQQQTRPQQTPGKVPDLTGLPQKIEIFGEVRDFHEIYTKAYNGEAFYQSFLGIIYYEGTKSVERDLKKAVYWFQKAADQNTAYAMEVLAVCNFYGYGVEKDYTKAANLLLKAEKLGDFREKTNSNYILSFMYALGKGGIKQDVNKARYYLEKIQNPPKDMEYQIRLIKGFLDGWKGN